MSQIKKVRGFQDIYGEDAKKYRFVVDTARDIFEKYNFEEIILPYVEDVSLFIRSVGEETDIVQKEMYVFEDRGGRKVALRPEGTASAVRAYIEEKLYAKGGYHKLFYEGAMFRYERPQAGRYRQFHQIGAEIFGVSSPVADAELIKMVKDILDQLGIDVRLEINTLGDFESRKKYIEVLKEYLKKKESLLCEDCKKRIERNPLRVLDCKVESCKEATKDAPVLIDFISEESLQRFEKLKEYLNALKINYTVNPRLVRGLDYYTDTVFEFITDKIGAQGTVAAGGRYDTLVKQLGGPDTPALGFAVGIERLMLLVEKVPAEKNLVVVIPVVSEFNIEGLKATEKLRGKGIKTELILKEGSLKARMKLANKIGARYVVFVSEKPELKDMESGEQEIFHNIDDLIDVLVEKI
ncbi:histidyl-tRNA synthetase [Persephonella hydrogeniphila]|uniref:Histidine--tRNA ligase n=1 Tax=Persephonella hydrogeniphila TaxID=198703 RepID=A0A285NBP5_9AQUI|nr:histidine--tRNA ligase [Persephonella hydrogeniphila]SNZ06885.1 histidyl-tRNA synthetase [Persephonella hydrogeniphila]